jgi:hypothetical protein
VRTLEGGYRLVRADELAAAGGSAAGQPALFLAFAPTNWWKGLVPLFPVAKEGRVELRRRAAKGLENSTEPFCFVFPLSDEPMAAALAGSWECTGTRPGGSSNWFGWELATESDQLAGRFDQNSEFRVAYLTGGTFRSNQVRLTVEYGMDRYQLVGEWTDGLMSGSWQQVGEDAAGRWRATKVPGLRPDAGRLRPVPLHEFHRARDEARRYSTAAELKEPGWERSPRPLGQVWLPAP